MYPSFPPASSFTLSRRLLVQPCSPKRVRVSAHGDRTFKKVIGLCVSTLRSFHRQQAPPSSPSVLPPPPLPSDLSDGSASTVWDPPWRQFSPSFPPSLLLGMSACRTSVPLGRRRSPLAGVPSVPKCVLRIVGLRLLHQTQSIPAYRASALVGRRGSPLVGVSSILKHTLGVTLDLWLIVFPPMCPEHDQYAIFGTYLSQPTTRDINM